jgi:hypothetical protein
MASYTWISNTASSFDTVTNWLKDDGTNAAKPGNGDTVIFSAQGVGSVTSGLSQTAVTFTEIILEQGYTGSIGVAQSGVTAAVYLTHAAPKVTIGTQTGDGDPTGAALVQMNSGATTCTYHVFDSASTATADTTLPPIRIKGSAITVNMSGGNVGVAVYGGETATTAAITMTKGDGQVEPEPSLYLGIGTTVTSLKMGAGAVLSRAGQTVSAAIVNGGTFEHTGAGACTALSVYGEGVAYYAGGTITTLNLGGTFDRTKDARAVTITNTNLYKGFNLQLNNGVTLSTVFTNRPAVVGGGNQDGTIVSVPGELI